MNESHKCVSAQNVHKQVNVIYGVKSQDHGYPCVAGWGGVTEIGKGNKGGSTTASWSRCANYMCVFRL